MRRPHLSLREIQLSSTPSCRGEQSWKGVCVCVCVCVCACVFVYQPTMDFSICEVFCLPLLCEIHRAVENKFEYSLVTHALNLAQVINKYKYKQTSQQTS